MFVCCFFFFSGFAFFFLCFIFHSFSSPLSVPRPVAVYAETGGSPRVRRGSTLGCCSRRACRAGDRKFTLKRDKKKKAQRNKVEGGRTSPGSPRRCAAGGDGEAGRLRAGAGTPLREHGGLPAPCPARWSPTGRGTSAQTPRRCGGAASGPGLSLPRSGSGAAPALGVDPPHNITPLHFYSTSPLFHPLDPLHDGARGDKLPR